MAEQSRLYVYDTSYPTGWKPWDGASSGGGSGITEAQVKSAIESATTLDGLETTLNTINGNIDGLETLVTAVRDRLINSITTYTHSSVSPTTSSTQVVASNSNRKHLIIVNRSTTLCYLQFGATATTNGIPLNPATISGQGGGTYEVNYSNMFTGAINAITSSGTATLSVMEGV